MPKGRKQQPQKQIRCEVCRELIKESGGNFLKCPYCSRSSHFNCAHQSNLIARNLFYYCPDHERNAASFISSRPPNEEKNNLNGAEDETIERTKKDKNKNSTTHPSQLLKTFISIHDSKTTNGSTHDSTAEHPVQCQKRTPNYPGLILLPPPVAPTCSKCNIIITDQFFGCRICKEFLHSDCLTEHERLNDIEGYWGCNHCTQLYREFLEQFHGDEHNETVKETVEPCGNKNIDRRDVAESLEENNLANNPIERKQIESQPKSGIDFAEIIKYIDEQQKKFAQDMMEKITEQLNKLHPRPQQEPQAQSTPQTTNNAPERNVQPENRNRSSDCDLQQRNIRFQAPSSENDRRINLTQRELDAIVEASIRRSAGHYDQEQQLPQYNAPISVTQNNESANSLREATELNRKLVEMQLKEAKKSSYRYLPKVKSANYEWKIFYNTFISTKDLYEPQENVRRIQEAIECGEIKNLGGSNLFNLNTYEKTLDEIDKRIGKPEKLLLKEKQKLINYNKLQNGDRKQIIKFIDEVKKFSTLVDKIGCFSDKSDNALIARLSRIIPERMVNGWSKHFRKIKNEAGEVLLSDMTEWLDNQIENIEAESLFEEIDPYGDLKGQRNVRSKDKDSIKKKKDNYLFTTQENDTEQCNFTKSGKSNDSPAQFCWFHNKSGHSSLNCYSLLTKTGQEVTQLAKENGICLICGRKAHKVCPQREKFTCLIPGCTFKHALIFCFKRKCQKTVDLRKSKEKEEDKPKSKPSNEGAQTSMNIQGKKRGINVIPPSKNTSNEEHSLSNQMFDALHSNSDDDESKCQQHTIVEKHVNGETSVLNHNLKRNTSLSVVCITLNNDEKSMKCALLLDSGSTISLIDEQCAKILGLKGPKKMTEIAWSGGQTREDLTSEIVKAKVVGFQGKAKIYDIYFRTIKDLDMPTQKFDAKDARSKFPHLKNLPLTSYSQIVGIIGTDQHWFFKQDKWIAAKGKRGIKDSPVAILTPLGYSVIGSSNPLSKTYQDMKAQMHTMCELEEEEKEELVMMQQRAMGLEYLLPYENDRKIAEEEESLQILKRKVRRVEGENCFEAPLLWKNADIVLPTQISYENSLKRLKILISHAKKLSKLPEIHNEIKNLLDKNYARKLMPKEITNPPKNAFYIPIFITAQKGKRVRLIWDAAAKAGSNSLNDFLMAGPNLYNDLISLIMQSREGRYLVKADISEMFHQVKIIPDDRPSLRFLFINEKTGIVEHYEMNVMIFGAICSPTTSQYIKNKIADEVEDEFPEVAKVIKENTYVDDVVVSFNNLEKGKSLIYEVREKLRLGGFNLVKLRGNHHEILDKVRENLSNIDKENPKVFSSEKEEKLLGYVTNYEQDTLGLAMVMEKIQKPILEGTKVPTKKDILKILMSIFDPLGLFSFFTSKIKLLYHWCCKEKLEWNESILIKQRQYWEKILKWLKEIVKIKIPRSYCKRQDDVKTTQLLIFGDAGKEMLCTVAYVRFLDENRKQTGYRLIASKTYTVPLKQKRSIPELELDIAEKAVQFQKLIKKSHSINFNETFYATDSGCVYHWINNGATKPTLYVKNRLNKILSSSRKEQWMWISTDLQPADYGTKFESIPQLNAENEWFEPKVFSLPEEMWFKLKPPMQEVENQMNAHWSVKAQDCDENSITHLIDMFSSYIKMRKSLSILYDCKRMLRIRALKKKITDSTDTKSVEKINGIIKQLEDGINQNAEDKRKEIVKEVIKEVQKHCFKHEIKALKTYGVLPKKSKLFKFSPFLDIENILRITTRLPTSEKFEYDKTNPIVLPKDHRLTKLIILHFHSINKHQLHKNVVIDLKQRFFIPAITQTVKKSIKELCFKCRRENAKPDRPMMGDLPGYRLASYESAFKYIIIDVCGPFAIRVNRRTEKRWLLVTSCLTTRAVNINVLHSLDSQSFLMALQNHINLRGAPIRVVSDNGLNFVGGCNNLRESQNKWNEHLMEKGITAEPIEWDFAPAKASSMNGSIERMIGLTKNILKKMHDSLNKRLIFPSDEVFTCLTLEIVGLLNNRPLTMIPFDGTDNTFLTPNHFLMQRQNFQIAPSNEKFLQCNIKRWEDVKEYMKELWDHFNKAYVQELLYREKWFEKKTKLEVGDVVVTADPTIANLWRLGIITKVEEGSKEQTRKVTVKLGKRNVIDAKALSSKSSIKEFYKKEKFSEITRPASEVAHINLNN